MLKERFMLVPRVIPNTATVRAAPHFFIINETLKTKEKLEDTEKLLY